jgi:hypothetical protein
MSTRAGTLGIVGGRSDRLPAPGPAGPAGLLGLLPGGGTHPADPPSIQPDVNTHADTIAAFTVIRFIAIRPLLSKMPDSSRTKIHRTNESHNVRQISACVCFNTLGAHSSSASDSIVCFQSSRFSR